MIQIGKWIDHLDCDEKSLKYPTMSIQPFLGAKFLLMSNTLK